MTAREIMEREKTTIPPREYCLGACAYVSLRDRITELEAALRKITNGPDGKHDHESGCAFEKFACGIAYDALRQS